MEIQTYDTSIFNGRLFTSQPDVAFFPCNKEIQIADDIKARLGLLADEAEISRQYGKGLVLDSRTFESGQTYHDVTMITTAVGEFMKTGVTYETIFTKRGSNFNQGDLNRIQHNIKLESEMKDSKKDTGIVLLNQSGKIIVRQTTKGEFGRDLEIFAKTISTVAKSL